MPVYDTIKKKHIQHFQCCLAFYLNITSFLLRRWWWRVKLEAARLRRGTQPELPMRVEGREIRPPGCRVKFLLVNTC